MKIKVISVLIALLGMGMYGTDAACCGVLRYPKDSYGVSDCVKVFSKQERLPGYDNLSKSQQKAFAVLYDFLPKEAGGGLDKLARDKLSTMNRKEDVIRAVSVMSEYLCWDITEENLNTWCKKSKKIKDFFDKAILLVKNTHDSGIIESQDESLGKRAFLRGKLKIARLERLKLDLEKASTTRSYDDIDTSMIRRAGIYHLFDLPEIKEKKIADLEKADLIVNCGYTTGDKSIDLNFAQDFINNITPEDLKELNKKRYLSITIQIIEMVRRIKQQRKHRSVLPASLFYETSGNEMRIGSISDVSSQENGPADDLDQLTKKTSKKRPFDAGLLENNSGKKLSNDERDAIEIMVESQNGKAKIS